MEKIKELIKKFKLKERAFTESPLKGVRFFMTHSYIPKCPIVYSPGICIVIQGHKKGYLNNRAFDYDENHYLVTTMMTPFECETKASKEKPLYGLYMDIDMNHLNEMLHYLLEKTKKTDSSSNPEINSKYNLITTHPVLMSKDMIDAVARLLNCLLSKSETRLFGKALKKELLYRALSGARPEVLKALANHDSPCSKIGRAISLIQNRFNSNIDIELLANHAGMSVSAFHRTFKAITSESPLQYIKKIRLNRALDFMKNRGFKAYQAAEKVGYESVSQFSREFKRYYGQSPAKMARQ